MNTVRPIKIGSAFVLVLFALALFPPSPALSAEGKAPGAWPPPLPAGEPVTVTDTIYGVLRHHRSLQGMQENRQVLEHELRRARAGFGPLCALTGNLLPMLSIDLVPLGENPPHDPKDPREEFDLGWFN